MRRLTAVSLVLRLPGLQRGKGVLVLLRWLPVLLQGFCVLPGRGWGLWHGEVVDMQDFGVVLITDGKLLLLFLADRDNQVLRVILVVHGDQILGIVSVVRNNQVLVLGVWDCLGAPSRLSVGLTSGVYAWCFSTSSCPLGCSAPCFFACGYGGVLGACWCCLLHCFSTVHIPGRFPVGVGALPAASRRPVGARD